MKDKKKSLREYKTGFSKISKAFRHVHGPSVAVVLDTLLYKMEYWESDGRLKHNKNGVPYFKISKSDIAFDAGVSVNTLLKNKHKSNPLVILESLGMIVVKTQGANLTTVIYIMPKHVTAHIERSDKIYLNDRKIKARLRGREEINFMSEISAGKTSRKELYPKYIKIIKAQEYIEFEDLELEDIEEIEIPSALVQTDKVKVQTEQVKVQTDESSVQTDEVIIPMTKNTITKNTITNNTVSKNTTPTKEILPSAPVDVVKNSVFNKSDEVGDFIYLEETTEKVYKSEYEEHLLSKKLAERKRKEDIENGIEPELEEIHDIYSEDGYEEDEFMYNKWDLIAKLINDIERERQKSRQNSRVPAAKEVSEANFERLRIAYRKLQPVENQGKFHVSAKDKETFFSLNEYKQEVVISQIVANEKLMSTTSRPFHYINEVLMSKSPKIRKPKIITKGGVTL